MMEERGRIAGDVTVDEPYTLWGTINGDCRVLEGGKMYVRGAISGDLIVEFGGRVHIFGNVGGDLLIFRGAKVIHSGVIAGNATNDGGRLYVEKEARVLGKLKTKRGETTVEPQFDLPEEFGKRR